MEQAVVQVEKFKASIEKPPGMELLIDKRHSLSEQEVDGTSNVLYQPVIMGGPIDPSITEQGSSSLRLVRQEIGTGNGLTDDDFFHMTCHIDPAMKNKIENGQFVDLDKLLPKKNFPFQARVMHTNETKLEWVQSDGHTYLVPAKSNSRINCFRRWEQAFRMYTTIYCTKNPSRAREIWQYVSVINMASMSYNWDNVYNYDIVFRELMEFNTKRSWAVIYNQMWNLSMTTPLASTSSGMGSNNHKFSSNNNNSNSSGQLKKKLDYCWSFNKRMKCKFGRKCKFIEKCSYCDSPAHGVVNCDKLDDKRREGGGSSKSHKYRQK